MSELPIPSLELPSGGRCPVTLYLLNDLGTEVSRRGAFSNLKRAVRVLTSGRLEEPRAFPGWELSQPVLARLKQLLVQAGHTPGTVNVTLAGVRGVLKQCWRVGLLTHEAYARTIDVSPARGAKVDRKGRCLDPGELQALFVACAKDSSAAGVRDAALFGLAIGGGLRRAELSALAVRDYLPGETEVATLVVAGKGCKERKAYVVRGARDAIEDWLDLRERGPGMLFVPINKGGVLDLTGGLSGQAIHAMMRKRARQAGVTAFSPHDCRRTFISAHLERGTDLSTVADLAGHARVETTRGYDRRGERAAIAASRTVHSPYLRSGEL